MEAGRAKNLETRMKGTINQENKLTDIYLPRKCDYTDRVITSKDHSSVQLSISDVTLPINLAQRRRNDKPRQVLHHHYLWIR
jgi:hypothetical protein